MSDTVSKEELMQQMAEIINAAREIKEINWDRLTEQAEVKIGEMVAAQVQEKLDAMPVRRNPSDPVGDEVLQKMAGNRYYRVARDILRDGFHRFGDRKIKQHDLWLARMALDFLHRQDPQKHPGPSEDLVKAVKAMDTGTAGFGAELAAEENARMLWDDIYMGSLVLANFGQVIDPMPADPYPIPLGLGDITWRKMKANTPATSQNVATGESELRTTEIGADVVWSYTLDEDSVVAFMPALRARLAISGGEMIDDFALNADDTATSTGNINLVDATPPADSFYLADGQDGIRHQWLVDNTAQTHNAGGNALDDDDMIALLSRLDKYGMRIRDNLIVTDVVTFLKGMRGLGSVMTVDKYGPLATVLTGELGNYMGTSIIVSTSHRRCNSDGKVSATAGNNTLGSITAFNRMMWYAGFKRDFMVEVARDIRSRSFILVVSYRIAVAAHGTRSSAKHSAGVRNVL